MALIFWKLFFLCSVLCVTFSNQDISGSVTIINPVRFPYSPNQGPFLGWFAAFVVVLEPPYKDVSFAYNFEANYDLPSNDSELVYPPLVERALGRDTFYKMLELKLEREGLQGKGCLLRTICEASVFSSKFTDVLGDIFDVLLRPSSSIDKIDSSYSVAEKYGKKNRHCKKYQKKCSLSLLDLISVVNTFMA